MNNTMTVQDLTEEQLRFLKESYFSELVNEGTFGEIIHGDPEIKEPSYSDYANIDEIISDDFIIEHYDHVCFCDEDFPN